MKGRIGTMKSLTVTLKFSEKDFKSFRDFENSMKRQLGQETYVGTDSCTVLVEYPNNLKAMLRPFPEKPQLEFSF